MSRYVKGLVAAAGAVASVLEVTYPLWRWLPAVTAGVVALGVVWFPNALGKAKGGQP